MEDVENMSHKEFQSWWLQIQVTFQSSPSDQKIAAWREWLRIKHLKGKDISAVPPELRGEFMATFLLIFK